MIGASAPTSASGATPTRETPTTPRQAYTEYLNEREASKLTQSYDLKMSEGTSMEAIIRTGQPGDYHYSAIVTFALEQEESPKKSDPFCYVSTDEHLEIITYQKNPHQEENNISYDDTHQRTANRQDLQDLEGLQTLPDTLKKQLPTQALQIDSKLKTNLLSWNVSEHPFKTQETSADTPNMTTSDNIFEEMVTGLGFLLLTQYHNLATRHTTSIINPSHQLARIFHTDLLRRPGSKSDPALDSHCDLGGMYTYSPASKCSSVLPH